MKCGTREVDDPQYVTSPAVELPLSGGYSATIDAADFAWLNRWKWSVTWESNGRVKGYGVRRETVAGKRVGIKLHRLILGLPPFLDDPERRVAHHRNDDGLDCRRSNLYSIPQRVNMLLAPGWRRGPGYPPPPSSTCDYQVCETCGKETDSRLLYVCAGCRLGVWV